MQMCSESNILEGTEWKYLWPSICHLFPDFGSKGEHPAGKEICNNDPDFEWRLNIGDLPEKGDIVLSPVSQG